MTQLSYVYVLTNQAMPGFVKIGMTTAEDVTKRMKARGAVGAMESGHDDIEQTCRIGSRCSISV